MSNEALKARLLKRRTDTDSGLPEDVVPVPGMGDVHVRALNRLEAIAVQEVTGGTAASECRIVALGMVDPLMTEDEVGIWQEVSLAGEIEVVSRKIAELSGMLEGAGKVAYKSNGGGPDDGVRTVSSAAPGDDAGEATDGDVG
jgi:hypothetical protein